MGVHARAQSEAVQPSPTESPAPAHPGADRERYLLLTNGQLLPGIVSETDTEYLLEQPVGTMRFPKKRIEGSFDSVRQAYEYRLSQLPERDSDERMKLVHWCLHLKLTAEAQQLLKSVIELNPKNTQANAMLVSINQAAARVARRERDPEVRQTKAEGMRNGRPEALDAAVLRNAKRGLGVSDLPVIFDLPVPLAIKRTEEFTRYVHPLLQAHCAKCHDGQYDGEFQLVPIKSRADRTSDALRANLDATLRLIDPKNPSHSLLLSSTLRPHGRGTKPRPIFPGSNDKAYKVLAEWANHLVASKEGDDAAKCASTLVRRGSDEVFAVDRNRGSSAKGATPATAMPSAPRYNPPMPAGPAIGQNSSAPEEFPIPFAISGVRPKLAPSPKAAESPAKRPPVVPATKAPASTRPATDPDDDDDDAPAPPKAKSGTAAAKKPTKPLAIDPKLLERALQNRNSTRPTAGSN